MSIKKLCIFSLYLMSWNILYFSESFCQSLLHKAVCPHLFYVYQKIRNSIFLTKNGPCSIFLDLPYATVTQPGHEPDLMWVKMGRNTPGIDGNLHTIRVKWLDTVFVFGFKSWSREHEKGKYGSVGVAAGRNGSTWVGPGVTSLPFMFAAAGRHGSLQVNQELDAGPHGSQRVKTIY
jgi:hypothetical protein